MFYPTWNQSSLTSNHSVIWDSNELWMKITCSALVTIIFAGLASRNLTTTISITRFWKAIQQHICAWRYLFNGPAMIQHGFDTAKGQPFELFAPDNRYVFVSSSKHIKELDSAPDTVLSLQAASKQMLQPVYTMHNFNWFDRRGTEGVGFIKALRILLTNNLPNILLDLGTIVRVRFEQLLEEHSLQEGVRQSPIYPTIIKIVVLANAVSFFGKDIANNEKFMVSALAYVEETLICAEIIRLLPRFLYPIIGPIIARRLNSHNVIFETLVPIAEQRVFERDIKNLGREVPRHEDCIQWIMDTSPRVKPWTAERVIHEVMAIWFGSVHALSTTITFAMHDLCLHPEYLEPIRQELAADYETFERTSSGLPLLDSFIKESARLTPVESMSTRRSALQPFTLSDGTKLAIGDWACTPVRAIMQDPESYPSPMDFNGFRFVNEDVLSRIGSSIASAQAFPNQKPSKLTDVDNTWHVWGTGRMACPGRWYAVAVMKVIVGQLVMNYNFELINSQESRYFTWRSTMLPKHNTMLAFTPRESVAH